MLRGSREPCAGRLERFAGDQGQPFEAVLVQWFGDRRGAKTIAGGFRRAAAGDTDKCQ